MPDELDKSRQKQYRKKVEENYPEQIGIVNLGIFYDWLNKEAFNGMSLNLAQKDELTERIKEQFASDPETATLFSKKISCRYGQNPGGPAAFYAEEGAQGPCIANLELLQEGKGLGYINLGDSDLAQRLMKSVYGISGERLVSVIVKHEMPSGVARGAEPLETYEASWYADPLSNFGGVVALSYEVTPEIAEKIVIPARNTEVLLAPSYAKEALEILKKREPLRVVKMPGVEEIVADNRLDYKRVEGGLLVENRFQTKILSPEDIDCVSEAKPTPEDLDSALLAWHTAAYTRSNAVVIGTSNRIHGIGSGQRSRIDSAHNAIRIANERGYRAEGTFMASDAFMPAADVVELCHAYRIRGIIYPLGSNKDKEVLETANKYGIVMLITRKPGETQGGERCFLHR